VLITKRTAVSPAQGRPERWLRFLNESTGGSQQLIDYLQRLFGYCLSGETREESLTFFHGSGGNGKGVILGALKDIAGDYGRQASTEALMESKGERHPADLADLAHARLVVASESSDGKRWDEQRVKALTGRDDISARFMRGNFFTFKPQFKILVASNHKPRIRTVDDAWRRRLHLVPFDRKPERPDPQLKDRLKDEYPQILQWAIEGAEWWYREGLAVPEIITDATQEYFREEDLIGIWVEDCVDYIPGKKEDRRLLYASYEKWCKQMGHGAATIYAMTRWFKARGFEQETKNRMRPILGVGLKVPDGELDLNEK
jgi:putative DNA primase/helicase